MKKNKIALAITALATATLVGCGGDSDDVSFNTATFNPRNLHYTYPLDNQQQVAPRYQHCQFPPPAGRVQ